eukprot:TRINITY_DN53856_c0_g1_i1.p2 TRINITY_DN53856_c0_g1~~TRINITY_DN53856_c0_g1_i1.p2  ORF type:complete len:101 (+),score=6.91 TRINITY_DN53856_c0_g1_i1:119-421(+)
MLCLRVGLHVGKSLKCTNSAPFACVPSVRAWQSPREAGITTFQQFVADESNCVDPEVVVRHLELLAKRPKGCPQRLAFANDDAADNCRLMAPSRSRATKQ